jgi:hypothetical protein
VTCISVAFVAVCCFAHHAFSLAAELIKHKGLLKNMLTTEEGGVFQKATAFNAPGSKYVCMALHPTSGVWSSV